MNCFFIIYGYISNVVIDFKIKIIDEAKRIGQSPIRAREPYYRVYTNLYYKQ